MIIDEIKGNAVSLFLDRKYNFIHGCNCYSTMGRGIALEVKERIPELYNVDRASRCIHPSAKLGHYTWIVKNDMLAFNAYTQLHWRHPIPGTDRMADYDAIRNVFEKINDIWHENVYNNKPFCIPLIGAGLAKGDWNVIKEIINEVTPDIDIVVVHYDGSK